MSSAAELTVSNLQALSTDQLRDEWERLYSSPAPHISPGLLRAGLAYQMQAQRNGGLSASATKLLERMEHERAGYARRPALTPGTRLMRDWHGEGHSVTVLDEGYEYGGKTWTSLSAIARHITGAKWSGPRFFGLTTK